MTTDILECQQQEDLIPQREKGGVKDAAMPVVPFDER